jgi:biopolymer transport protein ExbB
MTHDLFFLLAQTTPAPGAAPPKPVPSFSVLQYINQGGIISYILVLISFVAVAIIIRNLLLFRRQRLAPPQTVMRLSELLGDNDLAGAAAYCNAPSNSCFLTRVFGSALQRCARSTFGLLEIRTALEEAGAREADRLHRANDPVGIIAAIGPMLGLLGTVLGMIGAFMTIGTLEGSARSAKLAEFMSLALVNTAEGLIVAIPCTIAFSLFRRRADALLTDMGELIEDLANRLQHGNEAEKQAPRKPSPQPARPPARTA